MAKKYDLTLKGTVGWWNFHSGMVDDIIARSGDKEIHVLIDSLGGRVDDALSISSAFAAHGNVHVHYRGMNASAATIASMGAKHITIDSTAMYLVHQCSFSVFEWAALNADQLIEKAEEYKKLASDAEKIDLNVATLYARRCKRDLGELQRLMRENKWLSANEALDWGFVDEVQEVIEPVRLTASVATAMANEGMPVPENIEIEADGLISRLEDIFSKVSKAFRNNSTTHQNEAQQHSLNNIKSKIMKKTFLMVAAVLAAVQSALPEASQDGKFSLDEVQLGALEKALADAKAEKEAQLTEINSLKQKLADAQKNLDAANAHIAELEQAPAEKNRQVIENGIKHEPAEKSELEQLSDTFARAARMYKGEE